MLWNVTSAIVGVAVLPLVRRGALLFRYRPVRLLPAAAAFVALALAYSALHIAGMGVFRELAYALGGWDYTFPWSRQIPYELQRRGTKIIVRRPRDIVAPAPTAPRSLDGSMANAATARSKGQSPQYPPLP